MGGGVYGVAVNPAGTRLYVTSYGATTLYVVDTTTNTLIAGIIVGAGSAGVAVNPAGTRVYVAMHTIDRVAVIDAATNAVLSLVPVGLTPLSFGQFIQPGSATAGTSATYLTINRTTDDSDGYTELRNPVRMTYSFAGCNGAELSLAMSAPGIGLPWSFLDGRLLWQPLPADLSLITPFISFYAYNGIEQDLFYGDLPAGTYDIVLACDIRNGHLDMTKLNTGSVLAGMYAYRKIRVR